MAAVPNPSYRPTICLIDDDEINRFVMAKTIRVSGIDASVITFPNGRQAMLEFLEHASDPAALPDLIFLDINMPLMNGWEFLEEFERLERLFAKDMAIYMVSSSIDARDIQRSKTYRHVIDFIEKPLTAEKISQLLDTVKV
jgi:CheY-like chemotaxis protein